MGAMSLWHWLVVGLVVLLLFGKGRFSEAAGDIAKGIKSFRKGLSEDDSQPAPQPAKIAQPPVETESRG